MHIVENIIASRALCNNIIGHGNVGDHEQLTPKVYHTGNTIIISGKSYVKNRAIYNKSPDLHFTLIFMELLEVMR